MDVIDLSPPGHPPRSLVVFLRARKDRRTPQYYARRLVPLQSRKTQRNPYLTKALGGVSLERAKELAWQWWTSSDQKIDRQQAARDTRFSTIAESYIRDLEAKTSQIDNRGRPVVNPTKHKRQEQSIRLHLTPFFGPMMVGNIQSDDAERWLEWRSFPHSVDESNDDRSQRSDASASRRLPTRSTIQKDTVAFGGIIRHARLHFKVDTRFVAELPLPPETEDTRRPRFYPDEWQRIAELLYQRANTRSGKRGPLSNKSWWFRIMLFFFVKTLHGTGLRVAEAMRLKVKHLRRVAEDAARQEAYLKEFQLAVGQDDKNLSDDFTEARKRAVSKLYQYRVLVRLDNQLKHYTHQRDVIPLIEMTTYFDQLLSILLINLPEHIIGDIKQADQLPPEMWLFCHPDGRRIKSFDNGFDEVLSDLGLLYHDERKRSLTSLRHTYASERIEARTADLKSIADNMGTTMEMLYKHYSQEIRELRAADLQVT